MPDSIDIQEIEREIFQCRKCSRLVEWRETVGKVKRKAYINWDYWAKPVPAFGDFLGRVAIVGLAPGAHGSNRTGRMFTGDASGDFLYPALYRAGFANQASSIKRGDGLVLTDVLITAICRCVPPENKPSKDEIDHCYQFLERELNAMPNLKIIVGLGKMAFDVARQYINHRFGEVTQTKFHHGVFIPLPYPLRYFAGVYHPSRQNTQTGRLTIAMYDEFWMSIRELLD